MNFLLTLLIGIVAGVIDVLPMIKMKADRYSTLSAFILIAGLMCTVMGDDSPVKFIINGSPVKLIIPPMIVFIISFTLYRNSKKSHSGNTK